VKPLALEQIATMMRTRQFDRWAAAFLKAHPGGIVVDIGCGLDARPARVNDGGCIWFGLDFPEVIEVRKNLLPEGARERLIAGSVLDFAWMDAVAAEKRPVMFIAEGVFPYLEGRDVRSLVAALSERFPGGELGFDAINRFSVWIHSFHPAIRKAGVRLQWVLEDAKELESWSRHIRLLEEWDYYAVCKNELPGAVRIFLLTPDPSLGINQERGSRWFFGGVGRKTGNRLKKFFWRTECPNTLSKI
jgi:O-methyltransferase involved in polyketide biosynthesis